MNERQKNLLKVIVENYIKDAKPVGSKSLCQKFKCSSATIRNEMGILEDLGYIEKNHISSGRVPSEAGYKYYVNYLMKPKELSGDAVLKLQTIFSNQQLEISDAISKCVEIISDLTNYTSVILGKASKDNELQQVNIIPLNDQKVVAVVCTNKGIVENKQFVLPKDTLIDEVVKTSEIINKMLVGTPIDEVAERLEFEIKPIIAKKVHQYEQVYSIFYDAFNDFVKNNTNVHLSGQSKLLKQPEYQDTEDIKTLVSKFEDEQLIRKIENDENGINVYIGEESDFDSNVTVIKTNYNINGQEGTIAVIGPKRMEYDKVIAILKYISENLTDEEDF